MMDKTAAPPESESEANAKKSMTDRLAGELMGVDHKHVRKFAEQLGEKALENLPLVERPMRIVVTGGAGSGKSSLSINLAEAFELKHLDVDQYVKGGYTPDAKEWKKRLEEAYAAVWQDLPTRRGWVVEHVEACDKPWVSLLHPNLAILVAPEEKQLLRTAEARNTVGKEDPNRARRALETAETSKKQFLDLRGVVLADMHNRYRLKKLA
jgi:adenosyl cobinamide kinase/adenosyl cobinamide phosphate guanylyltransferase